MKKKRIAVTGGIGSGKTFFLDVLKGLGFEVYSCDEIYKEIASDCAYIKKIEEEFGVPSVDGRLDRAALSKIVFSDESKLKRLNEISHPLIMDSLLKKMEACEKTCFAEVPLLFEGGYEDLFDVVVVVVRDRAERIAAVVKRDSTDETSVIKRIENQFDYSNIENLKSSAKIFVLKNEGNEADFSKKIMTLVKRLV